MNVPAVSLCPVSDLQLVFYFEYFIISVQSRNDTGSQETMNARNIGEVIPAFLLPESRRAYKDRTYTQGRKEGENC